MTRYIVVLHGELIDADFCVHLMVETGSSVLEDSHPLFSSLCSHSYTARGSGALLGRLAWSLGALPGSSFSLFF